MALPAGDVFLNWVPRSLYKVSGASSDTAPSCTWSSFNRLRFLDTVDVIRGGHGGDVVPIMLDSVQVKRPAFQQSVHGVFASAALFPVTSASST